MISVVEDASRGKAATQYPPQYNSEHWADNALDDFGYGESCTSSTTGRMHGSDDRLWWMVDLETVYVVSNIDIVETSRK